MKIPSRYTEDAGFFLFIQALMIWSQIRDPKETGGWWPVFWPAYTFTAIVLDRRSKDRRCERDHVDKQ